MLPVANQLDKKLILNELTPERRIRLTNFGQNEIYIFTGQEAPSLMHEVGRLREIAFRDAGGGTGKELDIDEFDTNANPYKQLIVWNPQDQEIVGGYRYINLGDLTPDAHGHLPLATAHMFQLSDVFLKEYAPHTIELGRSFVQLQYQPSKTGRKGIFSMDNLWDGLGSLIIQDPSLRYFYGKVTLYLKYDQQARDAILYFLERYFPDTENLVTAIHPRGYLGDIKPIATMFTGKEYQEDFRILQHFVRSRGESIPPLVNAYMNLSPSMRSFGSSLNEDFGDVEEIGILVSIGDIYHSKKHRHIESFFRNS